MQEAEDQRRQGGNTSLANNIAAEEEKEGASSEANLDAEIEKLDKELSPNL